MLRKSWLEVIGGINTFIPPRLATGSETDEMIALLQWATLKSGMHPELSLLYHIPNEGKRSKATGGMLKAMGLKKGVPDICLPVARGGYHGLYAEMKVTRGKPTEEQEKWLLRLAGQGYFTCVCYGWETTAEVIEEYLRGTFGG